MKTDTIDPERLVGASRKISCYLGEHEIAQLDKLFKETIDKRVRKRGAPTKEECHVLDGLMKLQRAMAEGTRYPAVTKEEMAAA
jgi:hypothetical protein